jgi:hypothetical protein
MIKKGETLMKTRKNHAMEVMLILAAIVFTAACGDGGGGGDATEDQGEVIPDQDSLEQDAVEQTDPRADETTDEVMDQTDPVPDGADVQPDPSGDDGGDIFPDEGFDSLTPEECCILTGGTVETLLCCLSTGDFPDLCTTGPCGCAPENSHEVQVCICPAGQCFNGIVCLPD